jgi:hypothetical protein
VQSGPFSPCLIGCAFSSCAAVSIARQAQPQARAPDATTEPSASFMLGRFGSRSIQGIISLAQPILQHVNVMAWSHHRWTQRLPAVRATTGGSLRLRRCFLVLRKEPFNLAFRHLPGPDDAAADSSRSAADRFTPPLLRPQGTAFPSAVSFSITDGDPRPWPRPYALSLHKFSDLSRSRPCSLATLLAAHDFG